MLRGRKKYMTLVNKVMRKEESDKREYERSIIKEEEERLDMKRKEKESNNFNVKEWNEKRRKTAMKGEKKGK